MPAPDEITREQMLRHIGTPQVPVSVNVSVGPDFAGDPFQIAASLRHLRNEGLSDAHYRWARDGHDWPAGRAQ
ncbi:MAG: hypothetical protein KDK24_19135 [Pseudooceanicola sp.]|nr:hypothetical protein [Pseudooceanicola sp.]